jgi:hypothetical protein
VEAEVARRAAGGYRDPVAEVELAAVSARLEPERVAAAREKPRHRGVVALGNAADVEHVGRTVGAGVAAIAAEPDAAPGLFHLLAVARAEAGEALPRPRLPVGSEAEGRRVDPQSDRQALVRECQADRGARGAHPAAEPEPVRGRRLDTLEAHRPLELLGRDHALGELDELVARPTGRRPHA